MYIAADEEPEKKELLGVNTGIVTKAAKPNPFVKIFSFFSSKRLHILSFARLTRRLLHVLFKFTRRTRYKHSFMLCNAFLQTY